MSYTGCLRFGVAALVIGLSVFVSVPGPVSAQLPLPLPLPGTGGGGTSSSTSTGTSATALAATVLGVTTALASTGNLADASDALDASALSGAISSVVSADVLHATAISSISTWDPSDYVSSEASLADIAVSVADTTVSAAFAMAEATAPVGGGDTGWSSVDGLAVNGVPISLTGTQSETIYLPGLRIVANEVLQSASGITVNALHITSLDGLVDVVIASATAGINF